jgi:cytochrome P450
MTVENMMSLPITSVVAKTPPGPVSILSVKEIQKNPLKFLVENTNEYGDVFAYRVDSWSVVVVNHPDHIKHVLQDKDHNFTKEGTPDLMMLKPMLGEGLMTSEGDSWLWQRHLIQPGFHRERIESFGRLMTDATGAMLDRWEDVADTGRPLEVAAEMSRLTLNIVARALFTADISEEGDDFSHAVDVMNEYMANFDRFDITRLRQFNAAQASLNKVVQRIISQRRQRSEDTGDLLSMLMSAYDERTGEGMSDRQLRDQIFTLLMAGHETTAKALTWTLYLMDQHRDVAARLRAELNTTLGGKIPTFQDLANLPYAWMVIQEAMRVYPPVWLVSRLCRVEDVIGGFLVPTGSLVIVSPYTMHRHKDFWDDPEVYKPERFRPEACAARPPFAYLPFSGGPRQCVGRAFATVETQLVLATIMQRYELRLVDGHRVEPEALVTLRPKYGLPMMLSRLRPDRCADTNGH